MSPKKSKFDRRSVGSNVAHSGGEDEFRKKEELNKKLKMALQDASQLVKKFEEDSYLSPSQMIVPFTV